MPRVSEVLINQLSSPGTFVSSAYVPLQAPDNAIEFEAIPNGAGSCTIQILDSTDPNAAFNPTYDSAGAVSGITAYKKQLVTSVLSYIRAQITITSGTWTVKVSTVEAVNQPTINTNVTNNVSQNISEISGTPVGIANALPVGGSDGSAAVALSVDSSGVVQVNKAKGDDYQDDSHAALPAALYPASVTFSPTSTPFTQSLGSLAYAGPSVADARLLTLAINNNSGQTLTAVQLTFTDPNTGQVITYNPHIVSTLANSAGTVLLFFLRSGILQNLALVTTYAANPTGTVQIQWGLSTFGASWTNSARNGGVIHRSAITAADVLAVPGTLTLAAVTEAGSTLPASALNVAMASANAEGVTTVSAIATLTPAANQAIRVTPASYDANALYHDVFLSTDAAPKWVARLTKAQLQAGGYIVSAVGVVSAGGGAPAGSFDIGIVGTGAQTSATQFGENTAYTPQLITPMNCAGFSLAHVQVALVVTDLRSAPALTILPFFAAQQSAGSWFAGKAQALSLLGGVGQTLLQDFEIEIDGATGLVIAIPAISGQGAAATIGVELA